jgi:hypothetical protein
MGVFNLDKLVPIGRRAFNHAAKEKRKVYLNPPRKKMPLIVGTTGLKMPGAEFYIWNEANPLAKRNAKDEWYKKFFEAHTSTDCFTKAATALLDKVIETKFNKQR